jgi:cell division protein FtsW
MLREADGIIIFIVILLAGCGIVMVFSSSAIVALDRYGDSYFFLKKQLLFALFSLMVMLGVCHIPAVQWKRLWWCVLLLSLGLLVLLMVPGIGHEAGGATRWLRIWRLNFQPSELAKLALVIYLAYSLSKKADVIKDFKKGFLPNLLMLFVFLGLVLWQPDFGAAIVFVALFLIMSFTAGIPLKYLTRFSLLAVAMGVAMIFSSAYRLRRVIAYFKPWDHAEDEAYQITQSFKAFGEGGISGVGLGDGTLKLFYLPELHTDFIFSVIGEELGFIGFSIIVLAFFILVWRGISISLKVEDLFVRYLAVGITTLIGLQAAINMMVVTGMLPTKGMPLPFISYGGSSLLICMFAMGILLNVSSGVRRY